MKKSLLALALLFTGSLPASAGPVQLLDCTQEFAPIPRATLYELNGRLILVTSSNEGELRSRYIPERDWDSRILTLIDEPGMKGVLFRRDGTWYATFKGENGWYMSGNASCAE